MKGKTTWYILIAIAVLLIILIFNYFISNPNPNERHVNSIESILLRYHSKLRTGFGPNNFVKLDKTEIDNYHEIYRNQKSDAKKDSFNKLKGDLYNYWCGTQVCPCTDVPGGNKFAFIFEEMQKNSISKAEYSFSIISINNDIELPIVPKILNGVTYQAVMIDAEKFPNLNNSKFKIKVKRSGVSREYFFNINYKSSRAGAKEYKGDMIISNKF